MAHLVEAVLVRGRLFPAGTARTGRAAILVPEGPWWSGPMAVTRPSAPDTNSLSGVEKPTRRSTLAQIRAYAAERGVDLAGAATKADMLDRIG